MLIPFTQIPKVRLSLLYFFLISFFISNIYYAQSKAELFPSQLLVQPFTANTLKPKLGFEFKFDANELELNIGNSIDIVQYNIDELGKFSFGADLFTYTLLRSQSDFHFPVDAVDYLFGVNVGYKRNNYGARLRISHISAHFVDGHYSKEKEEWLDEREPQVYSREFIEIIPFYRLNDFRLYFGFTYIFSIDPPDIGKDQYQLGIEYFANKLLSSSFTPYIAYDFRLINIHTYTANNSIEAGVKYGFSEQRGISFYIKHFAGYNIHGEYFDVKTEFTSFGFNLDL
jgi:hypothetical protein